MHAEAFHLFWKQTIFSEVQVVFKVGCWKIIESWHMKSWTVMSQNKFGVDDPIFIIAKLLLTFFKKSVFQNSILLV